MNPSLKFLMVLIISLEISFTKKIAVNIIIIALALLVLLLNHIKLKTLWRLILIPLLPAFTLVVTIRWFSPSHSWFFAMVLLTRLYSYCFLGALMTVQTSPLQLARSLEQNAHLPAKFAYGTLAAINMVPRTIQAVKTIRVAGRMRGVALSFWSPRLYFKAILNTMSWADNLAQAMESQGFRENQPRTAAQAIPITARDWLIGISAIVLLQFGLVLLP